MRVFGALALCLCACAPAVAGGAGEQHPVSPADTYAATDFVLRDVDGRTVRLSDYAGQVVLLDFWATWCVPCEAEIPHLQALYQQHKAQGFVVLGVSMDGPETVAGVGPFVRRHGLSFPVLLDEETKAVSIYNPKRTAPLSVLLDRSGRVVRVRSGYNVGDEKLIAEDVAKLL